MKKRIFIAIHYLEIGGAESALIGLLHAFDYKRYDVDLFMANHKGELMEYIPKHVNLLPEIKQYSSLALPLYHVFLHGSFLIAVSRLWAKLQCKLYRLKNHTRDKTSLFSFIAHNTKSFLPMMSKYEYDVSICFLFHKEIFLEKVRAKKKLIWIHTDWSSVDANISLDLPAWKAFDIIVSISNDVTRTFLKKFPSLASKIVVIENILPLSIIYKKAKIISEKEIRKEMPILERGYNILSIGRFSEAKNFDNVPIICKRIRDMGLNIKWYIIGYGDDENLIRRKIKEVGMEEQVVILGKRANPYPYILACDIYIQPSRYEGKSVTVREAQMLGKPVVITSFLTAKSQIKDGIDGVIVPMDNEGCARGIYSFIQNATLKESIKEYVVQHDYANLDEVEKLYRLIG